MEVGDYVYIQGFFGLFYGRVVKKGLFTYKIYHMVRDLDLGESYYKISTFPKWKVFPAKVIENERKAN